MISDKRLQIEKRMKIEKEMVELSDQGYSNEAVARRLNYMFWGERFTNIMVRKTLKVLEKRA